MPTPHIFRSMSRISGRASRLSRATWRAFTRGMLGLVLVTNLLPSWITAQTIQPQSVQPAISGKTLGQSLPSKSASPTITAGKPAPVQTQPAPAAVDAGQTGLDSAFTRDVDLGDGTHMLAVSNTPLNYQAQDGSWQPIDPRFQHVTGGFVNQHNLLEISAGEWGSVLRLKYNGEMVGWEPDSLALVGTRGRQTVIARPLDSQAAQPGTLTGGGNTILYAQSWTLPGIQDGVTAGPGQAEQRLIFQKQLSASNGKGAQYLAFEATLHLLPGYSLYAQGKSQASAFSTSGPVDIRDSSGKTILVLAPPVAYEKDHPGTRTAGRYQLTPGQDGQWQVSVETSWSWWADPGRSYPAVLDPTMEVLQPVTGKTITKYGPCVEYSSSPDSVTVGKSYSHCGPTRGLILFNNLPTLPPGSAIQKAELVAAPSFGLVTVGPDSVIPSLVYANVFPITSSWGSNVSWSSQPSVGSSVGGTQKLYWDNVPNKPGQKTNYVARWILQNGPTGLVTSWLQNPGQNYGLELRDHNESEKYCYWKSDSNFDFSGCDYSQIPVAPDWTNQDILTFQKSDFLWFQTQGSGFALLIKYTPPTLQDGTPYTYTPLPDLPSSGKEYAFTEHQYGLPSINKTWTAVSVKGLHKVGSGGQTSLSAAGNLGISQVCSDGATSCSPANSNGDYSGQPNYFLVHGNPANYQMQAQVQPPNLNSPANADLNTYVVEADGSGPISPSNPVFNPNTAITVTFNISTSHILKVFNLNLADNTRVAVQVSATSVHPITHGNVPEPVEAYAFKPVANGKTSLKKDGVLVGGTDAHDNLLNGSKLAIGQGQGGTWGLVIAYRGDVNPLFQDPFTISPTPINTTIQLVVRSCAANAIPTSTGCWISQKPDSNTPYKIVGPYRVFSQAGFDSYGTNGCTSEFCTRDVLNGNHYAPFIVWDASWTGGSQDRAVAVVENKIDLDQTYDTLYMLNDELWLEHFQGSSPDKMLQIARGDYYNDTSTDLLVPSGSASYAGLPLDSSDAANAQIDINVQYERAQGDAPISRQVETTPGTLTTFNFDITWAVYAEGYGYVTPSVANTAGAAQASVSSLDLRFGPSWFIDLDPSLPPNGRFTNLRNYGKIVQPAEMGSAWQDVQDVILPNGVNLPGPDLNGSPCNGNCLDLRAMADSLANPDRNWKLPDVTITGGANTLMFSKTGNLTVFSTDQPNAVDATTYPFSFRTFEGSVTVDQAPCPGSSSQAKVSVIKGSTKIALPGLGSDTDASTEIDADFTLCETALREVSLTFNGPPNIPVGSTGLLITRINGNVLIGPSNTRVQVNINYHDPSSVVDGTASVTIDTAGLFDLQAQGKVVAQVDYTGHAWVAWNPLDVGVDVSASYHSWLTGQVHAHLWKGQGWQHRYNWLPDDSQTHFAGSISAQIKITKGQAFSWWFIDIPPSDFTFGIQVAFGQFCSNSNCTAYEWGVKGKFTVVGYNVGVYYGFDSGFAFILGSDGHVLIDQYKTTQAPDAALLSSQGLSAVPMSNGKPAVLERRTVANPAAPSVTEPLTVTANTGSFLAGLTWARGTPQFTLIRPDSVEITPANAASHGVVISDTLQYRLYGVQHPMPGTWQARITGASSTDDYHLLFLANKKTPPISFLAPVTPDETITTNETTYKIRWTPPANPPSGVDLRVSLYYTVTAGTALTTTQQYGGMIRENLPASQGEYDWDLSYLAKGTYHVYARVSNGQPGDSGIQPHPSKFGTNQVPGYQQVDAPGTIVLQDNTGPSVPGSWSVTLTPQSDAFIACWPPLAAHDLSGYVIAYDTQDVDNNYVTHIYRIPATVPYSANAPKQCTRIGGLNGNNPSDIEVAAYDHSGNLSTGYRVVHGTPIHFTTDTAPSPGTLSGSVGASYQVNLSWTGAGTLPSGSGYKLFYAREAPAGPGQPGTGATAGDSPIDVGDTTSTVLQGLAPGYFYHFAVQTYYNDGRLSALSNDLVLLLTNGVDNDHDGLPDDWEHAHHLTNPNADPDGDGLTNIQEFHHGTNPHLADTDGDGFSDGAEIAGGSDPLDPSSTPQTPQNVAGNNFPPRLHLDSTHLTFYAYRLGSNPASQTVLVTNTGGGSLAPHASTNTPWIGLNFAAGKLAVTVDKHTLSPGHYTGKITVRGASAGYTQDSPQTITVDLWLMDGPPPNNPLYLPIIKRSP